MGLLCLDLGQHTGWAYLSNEGELISGCEKFELHRKLNMYRAMGHRFTRYRDWLNHMFDTYKDIDFVVFEWVEGHRGSRAGAAYGAFSAILCMICRERDCAVAGIPVKTLKKLTTGNGKADKKLMMEFLREKGYTFETNHEADALALLHVTCYNIKP